MILTDWEEMRTGWKWLRV